MKIYHLTLLSCIILLIQCEQDLGLLEYQSNVADFLYENSGMELLTGQEELYMINDSGNANSVYVLNPTTGEVKREISISNAQNKDWEDLSLYNGDLFIGDFGNNGNYRKDLVIYWVAEIDTYQELENTAFAKAITFRFEDQKAFPPKKKERNFDVEAFFVTENGLFLFTRNRSSKFDGTLKCYHLPRSEGDHVARLVASYSFCDDWSGCEITSADYHHSSQTVALLSYNKVWLLTDFMANDFFSGRITEIPLGHTSQKEALCFKDGQTLYIGEESSKNTGGALYTLSIDPYLE